MSRTKHLQLLFLSSVVLLALCLYTCTDKTLRPQSSIKSLMAAADDRFSALMTDRVHTYDQAVRAYKRRRGRCPPPGFKAWFTRASLEDAIIVESFWNRIYEDLEPFWGISPRVLRLLAFSLSRTPVEHEKVRGFIVRRGRVRWSATLAPELEDLDSSISSQLQILQAIEHLLPDMDIAISSHVSTRLFVPWEHVWEARQRARQDRERLARTSGPVTHTYSGIESFDPSITRKLASIWDHVTPAGRLAARACAPSAPAPVGNATDHREVGFRGNLIDDPSIASSICRQLELIDLHGALVKPNLISTTDILLPLFSGSHIRDISTEITIPALHYWEALADFTLPENYNTSWSRKRNVAFWRGSNTGGRHTKYDWDRYHRHRFVALTNATYLQQIAQDPESDWASRHAIDLPASAWVQSHIDVAFTAFRCADQRWAEEVSSCSYLDRHFSIRPHVALERVATHRYLPDVDGNAFSARFRALLMSGAVVMKATIFSEWHDSRLVPWKHFVPLDIRFGGDLWRILCFFIGGCSPSSDATGHEALARTMGEESARWSRLVLRKEDIELYWLRLLLEYARVIDDKRGVLVESGCTM